VFINYKGPLPPAIPPEEKKAKEEKEESPYKPSRKQKGTKIKHSVAGQGRIS